MIPYVTLPPLFIGNLAIQPFALLVSLGVLTAHFLLVARAKRMGLPGGWASEMSLTMVAAGFAGAIFFKLLYRPELLAAVLMGAWGDVRLPGISSFGGLFGALAGGFVYLLARRVSAPDRLRYFDAVGFAFPFGFVFGRAGCSITHDHPGLRSDTGWLTVAYPGGARWDLGLLELLFLLAVCGAFLWLDRVPRPRGFHVSAMLTVYGLFRIALDRLHIDPVRYAGFSVDQWAGSSAVAIGCFFRWRARAVRPL